MGRKFFNRIDLLQTVFTGQVGTEVNWLVAIVPRDLIKVQTPFGVGDLLDIFIKGGGLPAGLSTDWNRTTGSFRVFGTPQRAQPATLYTARGEVEDVADKDLFTFTVTILPAPAQFKPVISSLEATVGKRLEPRFVAYILGDIQSLDAVQILTDDPLPDGLSITVSLAEGRVYISGTPTAPVTTSLRPSGSGSSVRIWTASRD